MLKYNNFFERENIMIKRFIVLAIVLISVHDAQAIDAVSVQVLDDAPANSRVEILNDHKYASRRKWMYTNIKPLYELQPGQIFMTIRDFTMTGFCLQIANRQRVVKTDNKKFKVTIYQHSDACDVEPDIVLHTCYGSFPPGLPNLMLAHKWLQFDFSIGVGLKANNYYGFLVEFLEPSDAAIFVATSAFDQSSYDDGISIWKSHGNFIRQRKRDLDFVILGEIDLSRFDRISDAEIAKNPDTVLKEAYETLQGFGNWRTDPVVKAKYADEIVDAFVAIARAKEAKSYPVEKILDDYYDLIKEFPDSPKAIIAPCKHIAMDKESSRQYAAEFLAEDPTGNNATVFCAVLIKNYLAELDYSNVEECVRFFLDEYQSAKNSLKLVAQLLDNIGEVKNREQLDAIIEQAVSENPNSQMSCAAFRQHALRLLRTENFDELLNWARTICAKFPETKLSKCAAAALADNEYQRSNFVRVLSVFKPSLFAEEQSEPAIIKDIDNILTLYHINTLRTQGIDLGNIYKALAKYNQSLDRNTIAVHCYRKSAETRGLKLEAFERAASKNAKQSNVSPNDEIWFWKGLFFAEESDLTAASIAYKRFLKADSNSILSAKAYYDLARAEKASGEYFKAKDAVTKAKHISPCEPVIKLERDLDNP